jgi:hypothetical protein
MRQLIVVAVAVLACVAYAMQAQAGLPPLSRYDAPPSADCAAGPEFDTTQDMEPAP